MKQIPFSFLRTFIAVIILCAGARCWAQVSCSDAFKRVELNEAEISVAQNMLVEFEGIKKDLYDSTKVTEANNNIHALVVSANKVLDHVVDYILDGRFNQPHPDVLQQRSQIAARLIEGLQETFDISNAKMSEAINNRVEIESAELMARHEAQQARRAIGFGRNQSSQSFHAEKSEGSPIGFIRFKETSENVEPIPIGFVRRNVEDIVKYEESSKQPIGFIRLKGEEAPAEMGPIGFVRRTQSEDITDGQLHQIIFVLEKGVFDFQKGDQ